MMLFWAGVIVGILATCGAVVAVGGLMLRCEDVR